MKNGRASGAMIKEGEVKVEKTAFLFPGQGSQSVGMGEEFYREYDIVREIFDMAEDVTRINLSKLCFKGPMEELTATVNLQPAVTAVNLGCLAVLEKEAGSCRYCAGHSLGEYSALHAAGTVTAQDAIRLVFRRGELMHREATRRKGAMQAIVGLDIDAVTKVVAEAQKEGVVAVANHNTEQQIVITGAPGPVEKAAALAAARGGRAIPLKVSGAWHSDLIRDAQDDFDQFLRTVKFAAPQKTLFFNVTADTAADPDEIRQIMARQLCSPVRWYETMNKLVAQEVELFVEVGPGRVLAGLLKKILPAGHPAKIYNIANMKQLEKFITENG